MAFVDNLGKITINRGDCFQIPLFINMGTEDEPIRLDFKEFSNLGIEIYLGVYPPHYSFEYSLIRKKFTYLDANENGDVVIKIDPQDTVNLFPGNYKYSIKATMQDVNQENWVSTIIDANDFYII